MKSDYENMRATYTGFPTDDSFRFDAKLVESVISKMKLGKAAGLDGLTVEHFLVGYVMVMVVYLEI